MAEWSQSLFLQALGWATLNSFWQMALLWCSFLLIKHFFSLTSNKKYLFSVYCVLFGFGWFIYTFASFYRAGSNEVLVMKLPYISSFELLPAFLTSASLAYLCLLTFPAVKMIRNWRFIQLIRKSGLEKVPFTHRLFVQKVGPLLGMKRPVFVYLSRLVTSPVTIGYLKPIILLPVAALNSLTTQQVEAILLHELSHIRRHDYLINLLLTFIHMVLYFNPFVKLFLNKVDIERENCCDELVLQFEYDKISYATALLELEKSARITPQLAIGAADKKHLLSRIEKIVGIRKKQQFNTVHFAGAFIALLVLFMVNSLIIAGKEDGKITSNPVSYISEPYSFFTNDKEENRATTKPVKPAENKSVNLIAQVKGQKATVNDRTFLPDGALPETPPASAIYEPAPPFMQVAFDEVDGRLNKEEKEQVTTTINKTKRLLQTQWTEVEKSIADGMTSEEKEAAKVEYLQELEKVDWKRVEQNLKAEYERIDWEQLNCTLNEALTLAQIDSIQASYSKALIEISKINEVLCSSQQIALPDVSVHELNKAKAEVKQKMRQLEKLKAKKEVKL